jgi:serine/threonine-protein kinase
VGGRQIRVIRLHLLGSLDLRGTQGEEILSILAQPKRTALLSYLAAARPRGFHRRDRLVALFWPELDQERARAALRKSLHHLRRSLGEECLLSRGDEDVGLDRSDFWCDVAEVEESLEGGRVEEAVALYRGPLLDGFFLPDCPDFDQWASIERERLRGTVGDAAWEEALSRVRSGAAESGEQMAKRAMELSPTNEDQAREFMRGLAEAGDRAGAVRLYEQFARFLRDELDLEPSEETRAVLGEIRGTPRHPLPTSPLIGGQSRAAQNGLPLESPAPWVPTPEPDLRSHSGDGARGAPPEPTREGHMVHWGAAYIAAGWTLIAFVAFLTRQFEWPAEVRQILNLGIVLSCLGAMILTWYHGRGMKKGVSGPELLMIALLLAILGVAFSMVGGDP